MSHQGTSALVASTFDIEWVVEDLLSIYETPRYSRQTLARYQRELGGHLLRWCKEQGIEDVRLFGAREVRDYLRYREGCGISETTVALEYESLRRLFRWCLDLGLIEGNPLDSPLVVKRERPEADVEAFSQDEVRAMLRAAQRHPRRFHALRIHAMLLVFLDTALRSQEMCNLRIEHIDFAHASIAVKRGKGRKDRRVPLGKNGARAIRRYLPARETLLKGKGVDDHGFLWVSERGRAISKSSLEHLVKQVARAAEVEGAHPHRWRHTAATEFHRRHKSIVWTQQFLGHSQIEMTLTYLRRLGLNQAIEEGLETPGDWLG